MEGTFRKQKLKKESSWKKCGKGGCRITKQRMTILDVMLSRECSSCKEIYYYVAKKDSGIGQATVYRMLNVLEEEGIISRSNMYRITAAQEG